VGYNITMAQTITRIAISNPSLDTNTNIYTASSAYLVSLICTNKSSVGDSYVDIWIAPSDTGTESLWGYLAKDLVLPPTNSFETFRFALNASDYLYVKCVSESVSFILEGIDQS